MLLHSCPHGRQHRWSDSTGKIIDCLNFSIPSGLVALIYKLISQLELQIIYILEISCVIASLMYLPDNGGMVITSDGRQLLNTRTFGSKPILEPNMPFVSALLIKSFEDILGFL